MWIDKKLLEPSRKSVVHLMFKKGTRLCYQNYSEMPNAQGSGECIWKTINGACRVGDSTNDQIFSVWQILERWYWRTFFKLNNIDRRISKKFLVKLVYSSILSSRFLQKWGTLNAKSECRYWLLKGLDQRWNCIEKMSFCTYSISPWNTSLENPCLFWQMLTRYVDIMVAVNTEGWTRN